MHIGFGNVSDIITHWNDLSSGPRPLHSYYCSRECHAPVQLLLLQDDWLRRAELAVQKDEDDLAKEALKRRKTYQVNECRNFGAMMHAITCDQWVVREVNEDKRFPETRDKATEQEKEACIHSQCLLLHDQGCEVKQDQDRRVNGVLGGYRSRQSKEATCVLLNRSQQVRQA